MPEKSWLASKVLWINGLTAVAAILIAISTATSGDGTSIIPASWMPYLVIGLAVVNAGLRFLTTMPLQSLKFAMALVGLLLAGNAYAADVAVIVNDAKPGAYLVTIDAQGVVSVSPLKVIRADSAPTPPNPPQPPVPPVPSVLTERAKAIKAEVDKIAGLTDKDQTAKTIAMLYREMAKTVRTGQVKDATALASMVKMGTDLLLTKDAAKWKPTRDKLAEQWAAVAQEGGKVGDYATLLDEAASGLDAAAPLKAISPELIALIMQILQLVLTLLNK